MKHKVLDNFGQLMRRQGYQNARLAYACIISMAISTGRGEALVLRLKLKSLADTLVERPRPGSGNPLD